MKKSDVVRQLLGERYHAAPRYETATAFAPTNNALCKYWGKRNQELNLPVTSSLSISLGEKGATTTLTVNNQSHDNIILNQKKVELTTTFAQRLIQFLDLFRRDYFFDINIQTNIPIAAGLASSACGFAALVQALNQLFGWELSPIELSILARLGSGSASRSIWQGFVEWHAGVRKDGMDSYAECLEKKWPELCIGLLLLDSNEKK